jgi:hypothetical protein
MFGIQGDLARDLMKIARDSAVFMGPEDLMIKGDTHFPAIFADV